MYSKCALTSKILSIFYNYPLLNIIILKDQNKKYDYLKIGKKIATWHLVVGVYIFHEDSCLLKGYNVNASLSYIVCKSFPLTSSCHGN